MFLMGGLDNIITETIQADHLKNNKSSTIMDVSKPFLPLILRGRLSCLFAERSGQSTLVQN